MHDSVAELCGKCFMSAGAWYVRRQDVASSGEVIEPNGTMLFDSRSECEVDRGTDEKLSSDVNPAQRH